MIYAGIGIGLAAACCKETKIETGWQRFQILLVVVFWPVITVAALTLAFFTSDKKA